ncbi:hypothetical protein CJ030_MR1G002510 [Morella rubra]|uniref:Uncharacterized protein n=1 Tax=Morella rubra TaxID=262757 RepID=A0A6A1WNQ5_9ROSI|nr:hypothetical protein CJ030_MR1G002510 [Morella rubra]
MIKVRRKKSPPIRKKVCRSLLMMTHSPLVRIDCILICQVSITAIGGKCQRLALTVLSDHVETFQPMQSTPGTTSRVLSEIPISSPILAQSSVAYDFELNYDLQEDIETVNSIMNAAFKKHKVKLHKHFKSFGSKDEALQHRYGDTSVENWIACYAKGGTPTAVDLFSKTHHKKNGEGWVSDVAREIMRRWWISNPNQLLSLEHQKMLTFLLKSLGKRSGYVRGLGRSVKPIAASSSTVSIQRDLELVHELEAAKATIEELKSRQSNYDNLKNQQ